MSIGLFIGYHDPHKEDRFVPIASEDVFQNYWKPICAEIGLRWLPRLQNGWMLTLQDVPHLLEELGRLGRYLMCGETYLEIRQHMLSRIDALLQELKEVAAGCDRDAFVGSPWMAQRREAALHRLPQSTRVRPLVSHPSVMDPKLIEELTGSKSVSVTA